MLEKNNKKIKYLQLNFENCDIKETISKKEALQDIEQISYILKNGFAAIDYYKINHGIEVDLSFASIKKWIENLESVVCVKEFGDRLYDNLKIFKDMHSGINAGNWMSFASHEFSFLSEITLIKCSDKYYIVDSFANKITDEYLISNIEIAKVIFENEIRYKILVFSEYEIESIDLLFSSGKKIIDLKLISIENTVNDLFKISEFKDYIFIALKKCFSQNSVEESLISKFIESADTARNYKNIVLDFRDNEGGFPVYLKFIARLLNQEKEFNVFINSLDSNEFECDQLLSPVITQGMINQLQSNYYDNEIVKDKIDKFKKLDDIQKFNPEKKWSISKNKEFKWESSDKKYEFILIVNRNTRSAGELAYYQIKEIFKNSKVTLIGENTSGCLLFCEGCGYRITNSKIFFGLSSGITFNQKITGFDEGKGFVPDFWVYNEEQLFDTIKHLTTAST